MLDVNCKYSIRNYRRDDNKTNKLINVVVVLGGGWGGGEAINCNDEVSYLQLSISAANAHIPSLLLSRRRLRGAVPLVLAALASAGGSA